jgi:hypothetical protein
VNAQVRHLPLDQRFQKLGQPLQFPILRVADPRGDLDSVSLLAGEVVGNVVDDDGALERAAQPRQVFDEDAGVQLAAAAV